LNSLSDPAAPAFGFDRDWAYRDPRLGRRVQAGQTSGRCPAAQPSPGDRLE